MECGKSSGLNIEKIYLISLCKVVITEKRITINYY